MDRDLLQIAWSMAKMGFLVLWVFINLWLVLLNLNLIMKIPFLHKLLLEGTP